MKRILTAVDELETASLASPLLAKTLELASSFGSRVWLLHVVPRLGVAPFAVPMQTLREEVSAELRHEHKRLQELAETFREQGVEAKSLLLEGVPAEVIMRESNRLEVDLIVLGSHPHSMFYRALLGLTGERLMSKISRPLLLVPNEG